MTEKEINKISDIVFIPSADKTFVTEQNIDEKMCDQKMMDEEFVMKRNGQKQSVSFETFHQTKLEIKQSQIHPKSCDR